MAKYTDKQNKWTQDYIKKAYDTITVRVPKGKREEYNQHAKQREKSLSQLLVDLIEDDIKNLS